MGPFTAFLSLLVTLLIGRNQPPWDDNWELDEKFFKQMEAWERKHPESTFAKVIENVNRAMTMCKPFLEHILDSPFPARSLVQGLAHLLQLGTVRSILFRAFPESYNMQTITSAKRDVYDFTMQVSTWFYAVDASFRGGKKKKFATQAKKNLNVIRWVSLLTICKALLNAIEI